MWLENEVRLELDSDLEQILVSVMDYLNDTHNYRLNFKDIHYEVPGRGRLEAPLDKEIIMVLSEWLQSQGYSLYNKWLYRLLSGNINGKHINLKLLNSGVEVSG